MTQARYYSSTASQTTLVGTINSSAVSLQVVSATGLPPSFPYTLILERDTANEEVVEVTAAVGAVLTVTRGVDGTAGRSHTVGATVDHGVSARDFTEPQQHIGNTDLHLPTAGANGTVLTVVSGARAWAAPSSGIPLNTVTAAGDIVVATGSGAVDNLPVGTSGQVLATVSGTPAWVTKTLRVGHTWTISGAVAVASGDTNYVAPFFVPVPTGQTVKIRGYRCRINGGTSATAKVQQNGVDVTGVTGVSVTTTTAGSTAPNVSVADGDQLALVVTAVSGSPFNLSFTLYLDYTLA